MLKNIPLGGSFLRWHNSANIGLRMISGSIFHIKLILHFWTVDKALFPIHHFNFSSNFRNCIVSVISVFVADLNYLIFLFFELYNLHCYREIELR